MALLSSGPREIAPGGWAQGGTVGSRAPGNQSLGPLSKSGKKVSDSDSLVGTITMEIQ